MKIIGLDLSLNKAGVAAIDGDASIYQAETLRTPQKVIAAGAHARLEWVRSGIDERVQRVKPDAAVVEAPAYGAKGTAVHQLAGLWWIITHDLWKLGVPYVSISPGSCKLYASGDGSADKDAMILATARAFGDFDGDNNAADALWLAHMGADHYGQPLVEVAGKKRRGTLVGTKANPIQWPVLSAGGA